MRVIFTYCDIFGKGFGEFENDLYRLSILSAKKFSGFPVEIYTDCADYFKQYPFDKIHEIDFFDWNWNKRYWNIPKIKTYSLQTEPFLHIDLDAILSSTFKLSGDGVFTERVRHITSDENAQKHLYDLPNGDFALCSGLLGISDMKYKFLFDEMYEKCKNECVDSEDVITFSDLYSLEEVSNYQLVKKYDIPINQIPINMVTHITGSNKKIYHNSIKKVLHNLGFDK